MNAYIKEDFSNCYMLYQFNERIFGKTYSISILIEVERLTLPFTRKTLSKCGMIFYTRSAIGSSVDYAFSRISRTMICAVRSIVTFGAVDFVGNS